MMLTFNRAHDKGESAICPRCVFKGKEECHDRTNGTTGHPSSDRVTGHLVTSKSLDRVRRTHHVPLHRPSAKKVLACQTRTGSRIVQDSTNYQGFAGMVEGKHLW